jgi:hypothetical protein
MRLNKNKILVMVLFPLVLFSCTSRKNKLDRSHLIPASDLTTIITDIYITNGLLTIPRVHNWYTPADTLTPYKDVIEKHGYKKEDLDRTLKWYFVRNPKKLEKIYDNVLARLSEMESRSEQEVEILQSRVLNLWKGNEIYAAPDVANDSSSYKITVTHPGVYLLNFTATVFPDDETVNPKAFIYAEQPDSTGNSQKIYFNTMEYLKDGLPHVYSIYLNIPNQNYFNIRGFFTNPCESDAVRKHYIIESITLTLSSSPVV